MHVNAFPLDILPLKHSSNQACNSMLIFTSISCIRIIHIWTYCISSSSSYSSLNCFIMWDMQIIVDDVLNHFWSWSSSLNFFSLHGVNESNQRLRTLEANISSISLLLRQ